MTANATDAGGFGLLSDLLTLCVGNNNASLNDAGGTQAAVQLCLADSTFQSSVGANASGAWSKPNQGAGPRRRRIERTALGVPARRTRGLGLGRTLRHVLLQRVRA